MSTFPSSVAVRIAVTIRDPNAPLGDEREGIGLDFCIVAAKMASREDTKKE
jgi:hypothetical protein